MCWLNSCSPETRTLTEEILTLPGSRYVPSGVVMRDPATGQMVIVEQGRVSVLNADTAERYLFPGVTEKVCYPTKKDGP